MTLVRAAFALCVVLVAGCPPLASTANVPQPWPAQDPAVKPAESTPAAAPAPTATPAPAPTPAAPPAQ